MPGAQGPQGTFGAIVRVDSAVAYLCAYPALCAVGSAKVTCPAGTTLTGGGFTYTGLFTNVAYNAPSGNGWAVIAVNWDEVPVTDLRATALCAS